jgi:hypothetical protein
LNGIHNTFIEVFETNFQVQEWKVDGQQMRLEYNVNVGDYTRHRDSKNPELKSPMHEALQDSCYFIKEAK